MKKLFMLLAFSCASNFCKAQNIETIYLNPKDSNSNLYIVVHPPGKPFKGYAFFIPGMFQKAADVLVQTDLAQHAAQQGILAIIPTFKMGISSLGFDTATQSSFLELLAHATAKYKLTGLPFYAGVFLLAVLTLLNMLSWLCLTITALSLWQFLRLMLRLILKDCTSECCVR